MSASQADLFVSGLPLAPERPPLEQLTELLAMLQVAERLPWPDVMTAMAEERPAYWLAGRAGDEGARIVTAIMDETKRLLIAQELEQEKAQQQRAAE